MYVQVLHWSLYLACWCVLHVLVEIGKKVLLRYNF